MSTNPGPGYAKHPEHRVALAPEPRRVRVTFDGELVADTTSAIRLEEATYPPVYYVPRKDVKMERLTPTAHHTYCPFKGQASYFTLTGSAGSARARTAPDAVWSYEAPYDEVITIKDHLAFYPDKASIRVDEQE